MVRLLNVPVHILQGYGHTWEHAAWSESRPIPTLYGSKSRGDDKLRGCFGMIVNQLSFPSSCGSVISLTQQFCFSNFLRRLELLRNFLLDAFICLFFPHKHTHGKSFPRKHCLSFSIRNRKPSRWKRLRRNIMWAFLFLTNPKKMLRCARNQLSVNIHCFEEISEVLIWPKIS